MKYKILSCITVWAFVTFLFAPQALAHVPVVEPKLDQRIETKGLYFGSIRVADPTQTSLAVYGTITQLDQQDIYAFVPSEDATIPLELLVPISYRNRNFLPSLTIVAKGLPEHEEVKVPFEVPEGYEMHQIKSISHDETFYEKFSLERYYKVAEYELEVKKGGNYFLAVDDSNLELGQYVLGMGTKENFAEVSKLDLFKDVAGIKLGLISDINLSGKDFAGLSLILLSFVFGLGSVIICALIWFMSKKSVQWTDVLAKTKKLFTNLEAVGLTLFFVGGVILYRESWLSGVAFFQAIIWFLLSLNSLFTIWKVNPQLNTVAASAEENMPTSLRRNLNLSLFIAVIFWAANLFLQIWYIFLQR